MIRKIRVTNYKSITGLTLDLGRVTVLIGANGSGKSNILEAIALASAAAQNKLDNEFLISRGIRATDTRLMRAAFRELPLPPKPVQIAFGQDQRTTVEAVDTAGETIQISVEGENEVASDFNLISDETVSYPKWTQQPPISLRKFKEMLESPDFSLDEQVTPESLREIFKLIEHESTQPPDTLAGFLVYCPENSALRTFQAEGQILPLGIRGEGLFAHLKALNSNNNKVRVAKIMENLRLIDWFENFDIPNGLSPDERSIRLRDRYLPESILFDQRSANEGFLFLLFYVTLFTSPDTPAFFSIDNIDSSLNPKLCIALMQTICKLAEEYNKQVILTTHNPAILDGLDLCCEEQRLLVVDRNKAGHTQVFRVDPPTLTPGQINVSLSEAFMRGYIGGLPKNF